MINIILVLICAASLVAQNIDAQLHDLFQQKSEFKKDVEKIRIEKERTEALRIKEQRVSSAELDKANKLRIEWLKFVLQ